MAGIVGLPRDVAEPAARRMLAALRHRGPDDEGIEVVTRDGAPPGEPPVVLVHARLAVLDPTPAGRQPMSDPGDRTSPRIVFNGEVYNFQELRAALELRGLPGLTRTDTEVVLHAWRAWGEAAVERARGMFAWAIADPAKGVVWLCRDRLGIKPLYVARPPGGGLLFASEVRALLAAGPELVPPRLDPTALEGFLAQGAVYGEGAIVRDVSLLPPARSLVLEWSGAERSARTYWRVPFAPAGARAGATERRRVVARLGEALRQAVRLHLIADVPTGLFLSGGVDSAALAALATEVGGDVRTVSLGFDQPAQDETDAALATARRLGTSHTAVRLSGQDVLEDLDAAIDAVDQPTVDGFNTWFVARAARRAGLTVALSGTGGDEMFGGYATFRDVPRAVRLRSLWQAVDRFDRAPPLAARVLGGRFGVKVAEAMHREPDLLELYLLRRELFLPAERRACHALPGGSDPTGGIPAAEAQSLRALVRGLDEPNRIAALELCGYLRHMLLRDTDVFSMAHGLEVRVPLLDHEVVELAAQVPGAWRLRDPRPKPLLQDAVGERLPQEVRRAPKRGFAFPWAAWLRGPLRARCAHAALAQDVWRALGIEPSAPAALWARFERGDDSVAALHVVGLLVLERWAARHGVRA